MRARAQTHAHRGTRTPTHTQFLTHKNFQCQRHALSPFNTHTHTHTLTYTLFVSNTSTQYLSPTLNLSHSTSTTLSPSCTHSLTHNLFPSFFLSFPLFLSLSHSLCRREGGGADQQQCQLPASPSPRKWSSAPSMGLPATISHSSPCPFHLFHTLSLDPSF